MSDEKLIEKIKHGLIKSGYPLELRCRRAIMQHTTASNHMWFTDKERIYLDSDNVEREIDAFAYIQTVHRSTITCSVLIVECKKNEENHWVFFDEGQNRKNLNIVSNLNSEQHERLEAGILQKERFLLRHHYHNINSCSSYSMAFMKNKQRNQIFEGLQQILKAYKHYKEINEKNINEELPNIPKWTQAYYPVIVFEGKLFLAKLIDNDLKIEKCNHVLYNALHPFYAHSSLTVDIIHADIFFDYLKIFEQDHDVIVPYVSTD